MTDRPILFSAPMVRAILADRKTQTRRVMRTNHVGYRSFLRWDGRPHTRAMMACSNGDPGRPESSVFCEDNRIGVPGDRLWVRETFCLRDPDHHPERGYWYAATDDVDNPRWTPSIFMPRRASRLTLAVTAVRVERLQAITEEDARAEGVAVDPAALASGATHRQAFADLWDSLNGKRAPWASDPWVWRIEFRRAVQP